MVVVAVSMDILVLVAEEVQSAVDIQTLVCLFGLFAEDIVDIVVHTAEVDTVVRRGYDVILLLHTVHIENHEVFFLFLFLSLLLLLLQLLFELLELFF